MSGSIRAMMFVADISINNMLFVTNGSGDSVLQHLIHTERAAHE